jgi:hypothetical protein
MKVKQVNWQGAAVHTREIDPGKDYDWIVKEGDLQLFEQMEYMHRVALRDAGGEAPILALLLEEQAVGLLIGDLPSSRLDHGNRVIYNTLYLEFDKDEQENILESITSLLLCTHKTYKPHQQHFGDYAEALYTKTATNTVILPSLYKQPSILLSPIKSNKLILPSTQVNRHRCARYLRDFEPSTEESHFYLISTGRVSLEKCEEIAELSEAMLLLTLSSEVESEIDFNQEKGKGRFDKLKKIIRFNK